MNKKAIHHVEYAIAVSIFIIAVMFVLYFSHFTSRDVGDRSLDYLEKAFREKTETSVMKVSVVTGGCNSGCNISLNSNLPTSTNHLVILENGVPIKFKLENNFLYFKGDSTNYQLVESEDLNYTPNFPDYYLPSDYNYSLPYEGRLVSSKKLAGLNYNYSSEYNTLKQEFGLDKDFSIEIKNVNGTKLFDMSMGIPPGIQVYAKEFRIRMINSTAEEFEAIVILKTW